MTVVLESTCGPFAGMNSILWGRSRHDWLGLFWHRYGYGGWCIARSWLAPGRWWCPRSGPWKSIQVYCSLNAVLSDWDRVLHIEVANWCQKARLAFAGTREGYNLNLFRQWLRQIFSVWHVSWPQSCHSHDWWCQRPYQQPRPATVLKWLAESSCTIPDRLQWVWCLKRKEMVFIVICNTH